MKPIKITDNRIRTVANRSKSIQGMLYTLGYKYNYAGSNTITRFKRILGKKVYREIASHIRFGLP